jgi:ribosomal protein S17
MWVLKRANADYYYSHYDNKSDLPIYTKDITQAKTYNTKKAANNQKRFGDVVVKVQGS